MGESGIKARPMPSTGRALRAVAAGGSGDINLLAERAAEEIAALTARAEKAERERDNALAGGKHLSQLYAGAMEDAQRDMAERDRMRAALRTVKQYLKGEMIARALVMDSRPESEWPTLMSVIDGALPADEQSAGKTEEAT
jgi:hypothetical protein